MTDRRAGHMAANVADDQVGAAAGGHVAEAGILAWSGWLEEA